MQQKRTAVPSVLVTFSLNLASSRRWRTSTPRSYDSLALPFYRFSDHAFPLTDLLPSPSWLIKSLASSADLVLPELLSLSRFSSLARVLFADDSSPARFASRAFPLYSFSRTRLVFAFPTLDGRLSCRARVDAWRGVQESREEEGGASRVLREWQGKSKIRKSRFSIALKAQETRKRMLVKAGCSKDAKCDVINRWSKKRGSKER